MANFEFTHLGWSNTGQVSGSFTGDDANSDGLISIDELSAYSITSSDIPQAAGQLDTDPSLEIVYGQLESGEYRVFDFDSQTFSNLFADPEQTAIGFVATGTLNVDANQPDLVVFQNGINDQTVTYNPTTGSFESVLATTPGFFSLA